MRSIGGTKSGDSTLLQKHDRDDFGAHPGVTTVRPDRGGWRGDGDERERMRRNTDDRASIEEVADIAAMRAERAAEITAMTGEIGR
jgi:hypothetical protein